MTKGVASYADLSRSHPPTHEKLTKIPLTEGTRGKRKPPLGGSIAEALRHY